MYRIPAEYYTRVHHVRPRFKSDIENVLLYVAGEISKLPTLSKSDFAEKLNQALYLYPGNINKSKKTINNWRTEISSLFGFIINDRNTSKPSARALELYETEDLVECFKKFLFTFQYPGAHIKSQEVKKMIEAGIRFKPAKTILNILKAAENLEKKRIGISKGEVCHCILNDLRCTRDNEPPETTWGRISSNRINKINYNLKGDVIRYAGDIIDYMEIANLLVTHDGKMYYLNPLESEVILKFTNSMEWFSEYDTLLDKKKATLKEIQECTLGWFNYVNKDLGKTDFATDILAFIAKDSDEHELLKQQSLNLFENALEEGEIKSTKDIGDMGEGLVYSHECQRLKIGQRADLIHLIKRIPTQFAVGYDILSVELNELKRYIEVKTTISLKPLNFTKIHLTPNEWNTAQSNKDRYFIYRLAISKKEKKLFIIQDPVTLYKKDLISMTPRQGAEITFSTEKSGHFEDLLSWEN